MPEDSTPTGTASPIASPPPAHYHQFVPTGSIVHVIAAMVAWVRVHRKFLAALAPIVGRIAATRSFDGIDAAALAAALAVYIVPNASKVAA